MYGTMINVIGVKKLFLQQIRNDKKRFKNISIYYEILSDENCAILNMPDSMRSFNCYDGYERYNYEKGLREKNGYVYGKPTDVVIGGVKMKRIIISGIRGNNYGEHFGIISGYLQAEHELVCYMVRY